MIAAGRGLDDRVGEEARPMVWLTVEGAEIVARLDG
jgi:hypothetical protein